MARFATPDAAVDRDRSGHRLAVVDHGGTTSPGAPREGTSYTEPDIIWDTAGDPALRFVARAEFRCGRRPPRAGSAE